jgi:hypothetical protein
MLLEILGSVAIVGVIGKMVKAVATAGAKRERSKQKRMAAEASYEVDRIASSTSRELAREFGRRAETLDRALADPELPHDVREPLERLRAHARARARA